MQCTQVDLHLHGDRDTRPVPANFHPQQSSKQETGNIHKCTHEAKKSIKRKDPTLAKFETQAYIIMETETLMKTHQY